MSKRTYSVDFERGIFDWMVGMGLVREWETLDIVTHAYGGRDTRQAGQGYSISSDLDSIVEAVECSQQQGRVSDGLQGRWIADMTDDG